jgi:hypothetical protein
LLVLNPAAEIKKRASKNPDGHHTWTLDEVDAFRARHVVGTKARLAFEPLQLALRRSDAIRLGPPDVRDWSLAVHPIQDARAFTLAARRVDAVRAYNDNSATPGTGIRTWLVDGHGKPFTEDAFSHWFAEHVKAARLPARRTPHGLRKRWCTDRANEGKDARAIMAVSGHLTLKEVGRYTRMADRARNADRAMQGRTEQEDNVEARKQSHHETGVTQS